MENSNDPYYYERMWRQSELEKSILLKALSPFSNFADENDFNQDPDFVICETEEGKKMTTRHCQEALRCIYKYQCADIEEIEEYHKKNFERMIENNGS